MGLFNFAHFMVVAVPNFAVRLTSRATYTPTFAIPECTTGRRCYNHICVAEPLHWVYCKRSRAAVTAPEKERCVLRYHFLCGTCPCPAVWTMFFNLFLPQPPWQQNEHRKSIEKEEKSASHEGRPFLECWLVAFRLLNPLSAQVCRDK